MNDVIKQGVTNFYGVCPELEGGGFHIPVLGDAAGSIPGPLHLVSGTVVEHHSDLITQRVILIEKIADIFQVVIPGFPHFCGVVVSAAIGSAVTVGIHLIG